MRKAKYNIEAVCQRCGKAFTAARKTAKYCKACPHPLRIRSKAKLKRIIDRRGQRQPVDLIAKRGGKRFIYQGAFRDFEEFKVCMQKAFKEVEPQERRRILDMLRRERDGK
jgi:hypothetical protein